MLLCHFIWDHCGNDEKAVIFSMHEPRTGCIWIYISRTKCCRHWKGVLGSHLITKNYCFLFELVIIYSKIVNMIWLQYSYLQPTLFRDSDIFCVLFTFLTVCIKVRDETFLRTACFAEKKGTSIKVSHLNLLDITVNNCRIKVSK